MDRGASTHVRGAHDAGGLGRPGAGSAGAAQAAPPRPSNPPDFLVKLLAMLQEDAELIAWNGGKVFIQDPVALEKKLCSYFRHSNFSSFQRQLNNFGFRKVEGKGKLAPCMYMHEELRGLPADALLKIRRKTPATPGATPAPAGGRPEVATTSLATRDSWPPPSSSAGTPRGAARPGGLAAGQPQHHQQNGAAAKRRRTDLGAATTATVASSNGHGGPLPTNAGTFGHEHHHRVSPDEDAVTTTTTTNGNGARHASAHRDGFPAPRHSFEDVLHMLAPGDAPGAPVSRNGALGVPRRRRDFLPFEDDDDVHHVAAAEDGDALAHGPPATTTTTTTARAPDAPRGAHHHHLPHRGAAHHPSGALAANGAGVTPGGVGHVDDVATAATGHGVVAPPSRTTFSPPRAGGAGHHESESDVLLSFLEAETAAGLPGGPTMAGRAGEPVDGLAHPGELPSLFDGCDAVSESSDLSRVWTTDAPRAQVAFDVPGSPAPFPPRESSDSSLQPGFRATIFGKKHRLRQPPEVGPILLDQHPGAIGHHAASSHHHHGREGAAQGVALDSSPLYRHPS